MVSRRLPIVGVLGSGTDPWLEQARPLGQWLATLGCHLLTGGGRGVMEAVSAAFASVSDRRGSVLAVLPAAGEGGEGASTPAHGYPNRWVEIPIATHLPLRGARGAEPLSRNHVLVLTAHVLVVLPGGDGTRSEVELARRYEKHAVAFWPAGFGDPSKLPIAVHEELSRVQSFVVESLVATGFSFPRSSTG